MRGGDGEVKAGRGMEYDMWEALRCSFFWVMVVVVVSE